MRRTLRWALALLLAGTLVTACGLPGTSAVTYTAYQLTCCTKADFDRPWQPGTTVQLHWIVETARRTTIKPTHKVVLTAVLVGPYSDVTTLKRASRVTHAVQGSIITSDDRTAPATDQVTTLLLPADLPHGYYRLNLKWDFGGGNSAGASSIVSVGTQ